MIIRLAGGVALAGCVATASLAQSDLPRPRAAPGEPEIIRKRDTYSRAWFFSQLFNDGGTYSVESPARSIAATYYAFGGRADDLAAQNVPVRCGISGAGVVLLDECRGEGELTVDQALALKLATRFSGGSQTPSFRALPDGFAYLNRSVTLTLAIPAVVAPEVDLTTGPLVPISDVGMNLQRLIAGNNYPSRALRMEIEGNMLAECQIQADLSVICQLTSFSPPEHSGLFKPELQRMAMRMRPKQRLTDGEPAQGIRFALKVAWRVPR